MMLLSYRALSGIASKQPYTAQGASKCIILVKRCSNEKVVLESKMELYRLLSSIIVKNIENFYYLTKNYQDVFHTKEDLISEAYVVFEACLKNFDIKRGKLFYMYYNKALTRAFLRIIDRNYLKHANAVRIDPKHETYVFASQSSYAEVDFTDMHFDIFQLSEGARKVARSKLNKQKIQDFLDEPENQDITWNKYFQLLAEAKLKLQPLKAEYIT